MELFFDEHPDRVRTLRMSTTWGALAKELIETLKRLVLEDTLRWLEFGLHGFVLIHGTREWRSWRRNAYLRRDQLEVLGLLEPDVRYHAPVVA